MLARVRHLALVAIGLALLLIALAAPRLARAQAIAPGDIPPELEAWVPWVLDGLGEESCTQLGGKPRCDWPGQLTLRAGRQGATFELEAFAERRTFVALPGGAGTWPAGVKIGLDEAVVVDFDGVPSVLIRAGRSTVTGRIPWATRPEQLPVSPRVGLIDLEVEGEPTAVRREDSGAVWLGEGAAVIEAAAALPDDVTIEVFRKIVDGSPLTVVTTIELKVAGAAREIDLGRPTLPGGRLIDVKGGELAVRAGEGGALRVSVRAGTHKVEVREAHSPPPASLAREARPAPWPALETWVFQPELRLRQVELGGALPVDPSRTNLPSDLRSLQTFQPKAGESLTMATLRRGEPEPPPAKLKLRRDIWIDVAGDGYTVVDDFTGSMGPMRRLDFVGSGTLGSVYMQHSGPQLITMSADGAHAGVEIRSSSPLTAQWRGRGRLSTLPAVGWATDIDDLTTNVHLPPGWRLLGATGVDAFHPSPLDEWFVLDALLLLAAAVLMARATRPVWGVVTAIGLGLAHPEASFAPWLLGLAAGLVLLERHRGEGRLGKAARLGARGATLALALGLASFAVREARIAVFPETEVEEVHEARMEEREVEQVSMASADNKEGGTGTRAKGEEGSMGNPNSKATSKRYGVMGPRDNAWGRDSAENAPAPEAPRRAESEVVQTGDGVPWWSFREAELRWTGPVEAARTVRVVLLGPAESALLALARCALLGAAALAIGRVAFRRDPAAPRSGSPYRDASLAAATLALCAAAAATVPGDATAAPSPELLAELRERLLRPPLCGDSCLAVASLDLKAAGKTLELTADVHAGATVIYEVPGPVSTWIPSSIEVDGKEAAALALESGVLRVRLAAGRHEVVMRGPLRDDALTLGLGSVPKRVRGSGKGWTIEGIDADGTASGAVTLTRGGDSEPKADAVDPGASPVTPTPPATKATPSKPAATEPTRLLVADPWPTVRRELDVGVSWSMLTRVKPMRAAGSPYVIRMKLWPGERVTDPRVAVADGVASIPMDGTDAETRFTSTLAIAESLPLEASKEPGRSEEWVVRCKGIWRCEDEGLAPTRRDQDGAMTVATWQPWPGEKLSLRFAKAAPVEGRSRTIDAAFLDVRSGDRVDETRLTFDVRSSVGGVHALAVPEGVRVTEVSVNGKSQPETAKGGELKVTVPSGDAHVAVAWQGPAPVSPRRVSPPVRVGDQAMNAVVTLRPPQDRVVVWTWGDGWGPRVIVVARIALFMAIGLLLARRKGSALAPKHAVPLAAGLALLPGVIAVMAVIWFLVAPRRRRRDTTVRMGNLGTVGLAVLSGVALGSLAVASYALLSRPEIDVGTHAFQLTSRSVEQSLSSLSWYVDRSDGTLPSAGYIAVSPWWLRIVIAAWCALAGWLVLRTAKIAWAATAEVGFWRRAPAGVPAGAAVPVAGPPASEPTRPEGAPARASGATAVTPTAPTAQVVDLKSASRRAKPTDLATTLVPGEERDDGGKDST